MFIEGVLVNDIIFDSIFFENKGIITKGYQTTRREYIIYQIAEDDLRGQRDTEVQVSFDVVIFYHGQVLFEVVCCFYR